MRLIDGTALFRELREEKMLNDKDAEGFDEMAIGYDAGLTAAMEIVKAAKTIRPEKGRWFLNFIDGEGWGGHCYTCSICDGDAPHPTRYCPHCGAKLI